MTSEFGAGAGCGCLQRPLYGSKSIPRGVGDVGASAASIPAPGDAPEGASRLNQRDVELLRHLAAGRSTSQAAVAMSITTNTVRTRIRRVQGKLAVGDRRDAVRAAREYGIV